MAHVGEELRTRFHRRLGQLARADQVFLAAFELGDVGEGGDDAAEFAFAVGERRLVDDVIHCAAGAQGQCALDLVDAAFYQELALDALDLLRQIGALAAHALIQHVFALDTEHVFVGAVDQRDVQVAVFDHQRYRRCIEQDVGEPQLLLRRTLGVLQFRHIGVHGDEAGDGSVLVRECGLGDHKMLHRAIGQRPRARIITQPRILAHLRFDAFAAPRAFEPQLLRGASQHVVAINLEQALIRRVDDGEAQVCILDRDRHWRRIDDGVRYAQLFREPLLCRFELGDVVQRGDDVQQAAIDAEHRSLGHLVTHLLAAGQHE